MAEGEAESHREIARTVGAGYSPRSRIGRDDLVPTSLVLVIDSKEYDGGTQQRWRPANDPSRPRRSNRPACSLAGGAPCASSRA